MKKLTLILALFGAVTLAHATTSTLFNNVSCNNSSYSCDIPTIGSNLQVDDATFTFSSVNCSSKGILSCDLLGLPSSCIVGTQKGSITTWTCTLDANGINYLNSCLSSGTKCDFSLNCNSYCNIGSCTIKYDCSPCPTKGVPDTTLTLAILGAALLGLEITRRKLAVATK